MTNKQLQQRTEQIIKSLGTFDDWMRGKVENPFPIGRKYAYNLARGKFDQCGKHGLLVMKDYFLKLENDKQKEIDLTCTKCGERQSYYSNIVYSTGDRVCLSCKKENQKRDNKTYDNFHR